MVPLDGSISKKNKRNDFDASLIGRGSISLRYDYK